MYDYQKVLKERIEESEEFKRKYEKLKGLREKEIKEFGLELVGEPEIGRVTLGTEGVLLFRLLRFGLFKELNFISGSKFANGMVYRGGIDIGRALIETDNSNNLDQFLTSLAELYKESEIGILSVIKKSDEFLVIRMDECISSAGMLNVGRAICYFEAGIIAGALEVFLGSYVDVEEVKCWGKGDEYCEFEINLRHISEEEVTNRRNIRESGEGRVHDRNVRG